MDRRVAGMIRAYGEAAGFLEAERIGWLSRLTPQEARAICEQLYNLWDRSGRTSGGDWKALDRQHIEDLVAFRQAFERLARHKELL